MQIDSFAFSLIVKAKLIFIAATTIESDWDVSRTETSSWDSREGTPRRYVRPTATIGSGEGRIKVRTVNGDVIIRRSR